MKRLDAVKIIGQRLSGRDPEDMAEFVLGEMQLVQEGILEGGAFLPWFLSDVHEFTIGPGEARAELPEGFLLFDLEEGAYVPLPSGRKQELQAVDLVDMRRMERRDGPPRFFALSGENSIQFFPEPDQEYDIVFSFYKRDQGVQGLGDQGENLWLRIAPDVVVNEVGKVCAEILRDKDAFNLFGQRAERAWRALEQRHMERRLAGQALTF